MATREHPHKGPRTGQTEDDRWIMSCETCGVAFVEGMEDMSKQDVKDMMELLYGRDDDA
jgi:hypothetical protein